MTDKIVTEQPKHDEKLLSAVEKTLAHHALRLKPGQDLTTVVDALTKRGIKLSADHGYLSASQTTAGNESAMHVNQIFESLAAQEQERFFPRAVEGVTSKDQLDAAGKIKFIRERGLPEWEKLPQAAAKNVTVVLDKAKLTRVQWMSLDLKTRSELSGLWGSDAVAKIIGRK
jgi:hypothetical protein